MTPLNRKFCGVLSTIGLLLVALPAMAGGDKVVDATKAGVVGDGTLKNLDVQLKDGKLRAVDAKNLKLENVTVNGKPFSL